MMNWIQENTVLLLLGLCGAVLLLFFLCIWLWMRLNGQKKRYDFFMGTGKRPAHNLEMKLESFYESSKNIEEKYSKLLDMVSDMDKTNKSQIQKVGLIRYNPFDEMGGNLCFALALLDGNDNGVVLNGIHSRTGSFTYAKPIEMGVSTYMLSEEEIKAVQMAKETAYQPEHEKVVKVRFKPTFRRKEKTPAPPVVMPEETVLPEAVEAPKEKYTSIGDVTQEEKERILAEELLAGKIAAAEHIPKRRLRAKMLQEQKMAQEAVEAAAAQPQESTEKAVENPVEEVENEEKTELAENFSQTEESDEIFFAEPAFLEKSAEEEA